MICTTEKSWSVTVLLQPTNPWDTWILAEWPWAPDILSYLRQRVWDPEAAMDELLPIKMAYKLMHSDKLDIGTLNREYFPKIGNMIGKTIRIGRVT